jgi:hypothetical protein
MIVLAGFVNMTGASGACSPSLALLSKPDFWNQAA